MRRPERPVIEPGEWRPERDLAAPRPYDTERFDALFEQQLFSFEELYPDPLGEDHDFGASLDGW